MKIIITIPPLLLYILCLSRNATYVLHITRELINPSAENYSTFSPFLQKFEVFFKHSDKDELVCDVLKRKKNCCFQINYVLFRVQILRFK